MTANRFFPFYDLGFRCNPFRALTDEEWAEVVIVPSHIQEVLEAGYKNLQVLGETGFGKTTMLLYLAAHGRAAGRRVAYERIPENGRAFQTPVGNIDCFLLDEAQRLNRRERKRLMDQTKGTELIIASHDDLAPLFGVHKRPLTTISLNQTDKAHLRTVLNRRLTYFALNSSVPEPVSSEMVDFLWGEYGRNIRAAEQYLYEYFQQLVEKQ